ncbi:MAG: ABC transporter substrate-binding protein [Proteobacteria bacterium]|nr:ABC transporter substrate-binding protein [Pseudomonadota bacterium]MBU1639608.1 ABC transporter substrate-binding protein [Pseudomonadota bacterium]
MMKLKGHIGGLVFFLWLFVAGSGNCRADADFVLVVNVGNDVARLSPHEVELIFLSRKRIWPDGGNIAAVINENPKIYESFSYTLLKRSPRQYLIFRKKMLFRGQGMPPPTVQTDQEVIDFVAAHVGGLGYVSPEAVTPAVKVVPISQ